MVTTTPCDVTGTFATVSANPVSAERRWRVEPMPGTGVDIRSLLVPTLTETLSRTVVTYGGTLVARTHLTAAGTAVAGATVSLYRQPTGSTRWYRVASAATDGTGSAAFTVAPPGTGRYRAISTADTAHLAAASPPLAVGVRTRVTVKREHHPPAAAEHRHDHRHGPAEPRRADDRAAAADERDVANDRDGAAVVNVGVRVSRRRRHRAADAAGAEAGRRRAPRVDQHHRDDHTEIGGTRIPHQRPRHARGIGTGRGGITWEPAG